MKEESTSVNVKDKIPHGIFEIPPQVDCAGYTTNRKIFPRCEVNCINCPYQEHRK